MAKASFPQSVGVLTAPQQPGPRIYQTLYFEILSIEKGKIQRVLGLFRHPHTELAE